MKPHCCRVLRPDPPQDWVRLTQVLCSSLGWWDRCNCLTQMRWGAFREPHHTRGRLTPQESFELLLISCRPLRTPKPCISIDGQSPHLQDFCSETASLYQGAPRIGLDFTHPPPLGPLYPLLTVESQERVHLDRVSKLIRPVLGRRVLSWAGRAPSSAVPPAVASGPRSG